MTLNKHECLVINKFCQAIGVLSGKYALKAAYGDFGKDENGVDKFRVESFYEDVSILTSRGILPFPAVIMANTTQQPVLVTNKVNKKMLLERDNNSCAYCGKPLSSATMTVDHVHPKSKGGTNSWNNLVASCKPCNAKKGDKDLKKLKMKLLSNPRTPVLPVSRDAEKIPAKWKPYLPFT